MFEQKSAQLRLARLGIHGRPDENRDGHGLTHAVAHDAGQSQRIAAAQHPHDQQLMNLIGELSLRSEPFRGWWAAQDVYAHRHGTKRFRHSAIGELELVYEALELPGDEGLTVLTYSAEPGTPSGDGLDLLASWAATQDSVTAPANR